MATDTLIAPLPAVELTPGMVVKFEAISPTTGLAITGVTVSAVAIYVEEGDASGGGVGTTEFGPFMLVPGPGA